MLIQKRTQKHIIKYKFHGGTKISFTSVKFIFHLIKLIDKSKKRKEVLAKK